MLTLRCTQHMLIGVRGAPYREIPIKQNIKIISTKIDGNYGTWLGLASVIFATINVVGGFMVTDRMLKMFKKK